MNRTCPFFLSLWISVLAATTGCEPNDDHDGNGQGGQANHGGEGGEAEDGFKMCCELGALCHSATTEVSDEVDECHELGHRNDPDACSEQYERCTTICAGLTDEPIEHACD